MVHLFTMISIWGVMNNSLRTICVYRNQSPIGQMFLIVNSQINCFSSLENSNKKNKTFANCIRDFSSKRKQSQIILGNVEGVFRFIQSSAVLNYSDPLKSSKVQNTVVNLKEKYDKKKLTTGRELMKKKKKPLMKRIKDELRHYYHGFRLFFMNMKVTSKLLAKKFRGKQLTRREHKLLVRTLGDLFRLVPFSVFIVVPFMELALPLYLKLFPGLLPSTFQTKSDREERRMKHFKTKLEMTKFLQETLEEMPPVAGSAHSSDLAKDFSDFFSKIRTTGQMPSTNDILKFSKLFEDEITLDKLPRPQIIALCKIMDVTPIGTTRFLRYQLRLKLRKLQIDDKIIQKEGVNSMSTGELREACRVRGMRSVGVSKERMKEQLQQWLDLSLNKKIPPSLLILSQAFLLSETSPSEKSIAATIKSLPSEVGTATKAVISEREGGTMDYEAEILLIKDELSRIGEETAETQRMELSKRMENFMMDSTDDVSTLIEEKLEKEHITSEDLSLLEEALASNIFVDKDCLSELKESLENYEENVNHLQQVMSKLKQSDVIVETLAARRLHRKLNLMVRKLDLAMAFLEKKENEAAQPPHFVRYHHREHVVEIEELLHEIKKRKGNEMTAFKGEYRLHDILKKLDDNKDGLVTINKVSKLLKLLDDHELIMNNKKIDEVIDMILKEEALKNILKEKRRTLKNPTK